VVNDRTDIAVMVGSGLHLGQEDMPVEIAREMVGQHTLLGLSTHNREQLDAGTHTRADYLAFGPVFATANKSNPDPVVGLARLREARALADRPLVAIGGITRDNALSALEAGADSLAVIGDLFPAECTRDTIRQRVQEWFEVLHG
jgi:thiamine-phosphate pyrophosphorylase